MIINGCEISLILKSKNALATTVCSIVSLFWRIRKSGESWILFPWRYHRTCRGGLPRTLHSRTTTWPSDAWASCRSCTQEGMISQNIMEKIRERSWEKGASNRWQVQKKEKDGMAVAYMQTAKWMNLSYKAIKKIKAYFHRTSTLANQESPLIGSIWSLRFVPQAIR